MFAEITITELESIPSFSDTSRMLHGQAAGAQQEYSMEDSEGVFFIGAHKAPSNFWDGLIDDIRIYNRALSSEEIAGLGGRTQPFDEPF